MGVPPYIPDNGDDGAVTIGDISRRLVVRLIEAEAADPVEQKARIMTAREHGHLTDREAADWIAVLALEEA